MKPYKVTRINKDIGATTFHLIGNWLIIYFVK